MNHFERLIRHFEQFPGIGSRQAKRFAFHVLTMSQEDSTDLAGLIEGLRETMSNCPSCARFYAKRGTSPLCDICASSARDRSKLTVVERDTDIDAIERSGIYDGLYFVLGGTVPLLETQDIKKLRGGMLKHLVGERIQQGLTEVILAFSINPDGENTGRYIETLLRQFVESDAITISHLGRGLSTGSELEYADPDTIKNALKNRY